MTDDEIKALLAELLENGFYFIPLQDGHDYDWCLTVNDLLDRLLAHRGKCCHVNLDRLGVTVTLYDL